MSSAVNSPVAPSDQIEPYPPRGFGSPGLIATILLLAGSVLVAAYRQQEWEFPLVRALNHFAHHSMLLDRTMHALTTRDLLQGVPFIGLIWFLWFAGEDTASRARLLVGERIAASHAPGVHEAASFNWSCLLTCGRCISPSWGLCCRLG